MKNLISLSSLWKRLPFTKGNYVTGGDYVTVATVYETLEGSDLGSKECPIATLHENDIGKRRIQIVNTEEDFQLDKSYFLATFGWAWKEGIMSTTSLPNTKMSKDVYLKIGYKRLGTASINGQLPQGENIIVSYVFFENSEGDRRLVRTCETNFRCSCKNLENEYYNGWAINLTDINDLPFVTLEGNTDKPVPSRTIEGDIIEVDFSGKDSPS